MLNGKEEKKIVRNAIAHQCQRRVLRQCDKFLGAPIGVKLPG
jgi:hypothetical protein